MNILMAVNSAYVKHAKVAVYSLGYHNPDYIRVYLFHSELQEKELRSLKTFVRTKCHGELLPIFLDGKEFEKLPIRGHFSKETYYRVYAQYLLPKEVDRVLWLDADLVVKKSLKEFYEKDFKGKCLISCNNRGDSNTESIKRLGMKGTEYFNAGVLLMNLEEMRRYAAQDALETFIRENLSLFVWQDQDILNSFFEGSFILEDISYNYQVYMQDKKEERAVRDAAVLHYVGAIKPWNYAYTGSVKEYYYAYLKKVSKKRYFWVKTTSWLYCLLKRRGA